MKTETVMPRFRSYRPFKPDWKYEKKCCNECDKEYLTDNMMGAKKGSYNFFGIVFDVTTYENNHSLCHDCGVCVVMDLALALSDICE